MHIRHALIKVDDQDKALSFYTSILGFVKKHDHTIGAVRWLTVVEPQAAAAMELVLEPNHFPPARAAQKTLYDANFPATVLTTGDLAAEYERLKALGVVFRSEPKNVGPVATAFFEDTCGNVIALVQPAS